LLLVGIIIGASQLELSSRPLVRMTFLPQLPYFALGLLFADLYVRNPDLFRSRSILWNGVGLVGLVALVAALVAGGRRGQLPWVLGVFCLAVFKGQVWNRLFTAPLFLAVGAMSYTVYLYHFPIVLAVGRGLQHVLGDNASLHTLLMHCVAVVGATLMISALLFRLCEQPFMDKQWPARWLAWWRGRRGGVVMSEERWPKR
jgi:peptidoglycan/LPS O-acetylase OafA/YrhL